MPDNGYCKCPKYSTRDSNKCECNYPFIKNAAKLCECPAETTLKADECVCDDEDKNLEKVEKTAKCVCYLGKLWDEAKKKCLCPDTTIFDKEAKKCVKNC